jgi:hypothetical protein
MSQVLEDFKRFALAKDWANAVRYCNGLNMYEMLRGLDDLPRSLLDDMRAQLALFTGMYFIERINYAIDVVQLRKLPAIAPGDLSQTGQVQEAVSFLATAPKLRPSSVKHLKVTLFWTVFAQNESVSSGLIQKAQELLHNNGNQYTLDVLRNRTILPVSQDLNETDPESCQAEEYVQVQTLAEKSAQFSPDRLPIIFYTSERLLDHFGNVRDPISHGCGYQSSRSRGFAMINVRRVHADQLTLMHELGHGAGLGHENDDSNFMSYGSFRTIINPVQRVKLGTAFFCS